MTQVLKIADMDFKAAIITMFKGVKKNMLVVNKKGKRKAHLNRDKKENQVEILELKKYNINKSFTR